MLKEDKRMYYCYMFTIAFILGAMTCSCNGGWSVGGYQLTDADSTVFHHIKDHQDEVHWYRKIIAGENWCYKHETYENVEVK